jgi:hypothetical protein
VFKPIPDSKEEVPGIVEVNTDEPLYRRVDCWLDDVCWFKNQEKCKADPVCAAEHRKWLECMEDEKCYDEWLACYEDPACSGKIPLTPTEPVNPPAEPKQPVEPVKPPVEP